MKEWMKMPSDWVREKSFLKKMTWKNSEKSNYISALMIYIVLIHYVNDDRDKDDYGFCSLTYTNLSDISGLSREKISYGLTILSDNNMISFTKKGRNNVYKIINYDCRSGWAKLPAKGLYRRDSENEIKVLMAFEKFNLRLKNELNAIKIYLLIVSFRDESKNYIKIGYEKIYEYTGVHHNEIKLALSLLINLNLVKVDTVNINNTDIEEINIQHMYRLCHLENRKHGGTIIRKGEE